MMMMLMMMIQRFISPHYFYINPSYASEIGCFLAHHLPNPAGALCLICTQIGLEYVNDICSRIKCGESWVFDTGAKRPGKGGKYEAELEKRVDKKQRK